jgi:SagB-type dehydrogenase family enzyme
MTRERTLIAFVCAAAVALGSVGTAGAQSQIKLPAPEFKGKSTVSAAILSRKTIRQFARSPLTLRQVSQLLWAADGQLPTDAISGATRRVTASAGGLYPLEVFLISGQGTVKNLPAGVYRYSPAGNSLRSIVSGDKRQLLAHSALSQMWLARAPALVVIGGIFGKTTPRYGKRGINYVFMEAGIAMQSLCLQAVAIGLRSGTVGAFNDAQLAAALNLPSSVAPLLIVAVGK